MSTSPPTPAARAVPAGAVANLVLCARLAGEEPTRLRLRLTGPGRRPGPVSGPEYDRLATVVNARFTHRGLRSPLALIQDH